MKISLHIFLAFSITSSALGQSGGQSTSISFDKIILRVQEPGPIALMRQKGDSVDFSSLYRTDDFNVSISETPVAFDTTHLVIENPYYVDNFDDYRDNQVNYPVSYSVVYDNTLVSLFGNGKFVCHSLEDYERNINFEKKLNTKKFRYHWIVNGRLSALAGNTLFVWNGSEWSISKSNFPLKRQPKLYEDDEFIVFGDCYGEWGGTIYFFDKASGETFFTESTCANSVVKEGGKYLVLAHLGHGAGTSEIKSIAKPRKLTKAKKRQINKMKNGEALGYSDESDACEILLDMSLVQAFSTFEYEGRPLYLVHLSGCTFLAEMNGTEIQIVHPLFDSEIYTHNPVTSSYENYTLINLDFYGTALEREVSVMIVDGKSIIKIDWNEDHTH